MTRPRWYSQPFPPEGASAAEGIRNQLGRPSLDALTILVRESAQNSWDARSSDDTPVDYRIDLRAVGPAHANAWRDLLHTGAPADSHLPLRKSLRRPQIRIMSISDRGTRGLGGPTRADSAVATHHDFVSFVRNVGEPRDNALGGGTYGFGKGIFFLVSATGTVLLHTRCRVGEGRYETRLIACALWESYLAEENGLDKRYTGRHWWGDTSGEVIEPLVDTAADDVARKLGLDPFGPAETGTTIVVVDPRFDDPESGAGARTPREVADHLAETISWQLWPKMLHGQDGAPRMRFGVRCDGVDLGVPDPRTTRPLNMFVAAYEKMAGPAGEELSCGRPKRRLGRLGLEKRPTPPLEPTEASRAAGIERQSHHVCLMRSAELVVTYHAGPKPPSEFLSYAGVFRANSELDDTYARAEPPTHDAWNHQFLDHSDGTFVRTTFTRIKEAVGKLLELTGSAGGGSAKMALGAASSLLSPLVGGSWGLGGATAYGPPGSTRTPSRPDADDEDDSDEDEMPEPEGPSRAAGTPATEPGGAPTPHEGGASGGAGTGDTGGLPVNDATPRRRRPRLQYLGEPFFDEHEGAAVLVQEFRLPVPGPQEVRVELGVAIAGGEGRETEPPVGAAMPELLGWGDADTVASDKPVLVTEGDPERHLRVLIRPAPDTMTEIELSVKAVRS